MSDFLRIDHSLFIAEGDVFHTPIIYRRKFNYLQLFSIVMLSSRRIYCHGFCCCCHRCCHICMVWAQVARATHAIYQKRQFLNNHLYQRQCDGFSLFHSSLIWSWDRLNLKISVNDKYKNNSKGFFSPLSLSSPLLALNSSGLGMFFSCALIYQHRIKSSQTVKTLMNDFEALTGWTLQISDFNETI